MRLVGSVIRVDRSSQRAEVMVSGSTGAVMLPYPDQLRPPPPLSQVLLTQVGSGSWLISDTVNPRQEVFHEDFLKVVRDGNGTVWCDTVWAEDATSGAATQTTAAGGIGVVKVEAGPSATFFANLLKDDQSITIDAEVALWLSARVAPTTVTDSDHTVGFSDATGLFKADLEYTSSDGQLVLATIFGSTVIPFRPSAFSFYDLDIILVGGEFTAAWVNGSGPYVLSSVLTPLPGDGTQPFLYCQTHVDGFRSISCDWIHLEAFPNPVHPERLYENAAAGPLTKGSGI